MTHQLEGWLHAGGLWARTAADNEVPKMGNAFENGVHLKERPGGVDESHEQHPLAKLGVLRSFGGGEWPM